MTYDEYEDMVKNNKPFIVVIERTGCSYCQMYMPIMEEVAKEKKIAITYINTDNLTNDEYTKLSTTNKYLKKNQWGTPTTLFMVGDRIVDSIGGYVEKDSVLAFLKDKVVYGE
jgi:predicted bacteriocin transport accessory protein